MSSLPLSFSSTATTNNSPWFSFSGGAYRLSSSQTFHTSVSFRSTLQKYTSSRLRVPSSLAVKMMAELVQDKESVLTAVRTSCSSGDEDEEEKWRKKELNHSRTFIDARSEEELLSGIKKELKAGKLPPNVATGMDELHQNYKNAVFNSGVSGADEIVLSNMAAVFDRIICEMEDPFVFSPHHKALREPFDYYMFGQNYIRPLVDFKNSYVGNLPIFYEIEDKLRQGHNIVLISNHQTEADPAAIALSLEATNPYIAENLNYVAGDRVVTDSLCKPFSMGRNLICVYSKNHMHDVPELVDMKRRANTRSLKEMAMLLRAGSQIVWIAPSGGRDRPDPLTGEWNPAPFDSSSVDNIRRLAQHSGTPGHLYPMALLCHDIMPPPPKVEKEIGEKRLVAFHGVGVSVAPEISFTEFSDACANPEEAKEAYSQALHNSVTEQYEVFRSAIHGKLGIEASTTNVSLSQPWITNRE